MKNNIIWIDIETTGTNYYKDKILQIACVITDSNFSIIEEREWIVKHNVTLAKLSSNKFVKEMHNKTNLWNRIKTEGISLRKIDEQLSEIIQKYKEPNCPVNIGGNSVHFDMNFIQAQMEASGKLISHRVLDISAVLQFMESIDDKVALPKHIVSHDAFDDISWSITQARYIKQHIDKGDKR